MPLRLLPTAASCLALSAAALAVPLGTAITYQGRLTQDGTPANGLFDLQLCLFEDAAAAVPLACANNFEDVPVADGLFTVAPDFGGSAFIGERRFLELRVRAGASTGGFTPLAPRQPLRPAPEALRAAAASAAPWTGLSGVPAGFADGIDDAGGSVTSVGSGFGLSGGPITGAGTLSVDTSVVQRRVTGTCTAAQALRGVNADGSVACGPDANSGGTVTSVSTGTGLSGGTITGAGTIGIANGGVGLAQINTAEVQRRVSGNCTAGAMISAINADGTVSCVAAPKRAFPSLLATSGNGGSDVSVAMRHDGKPVLAYHNPGAGNGSLRVKLCDTPHCATGVERTLDPGGNVGWETDVEIRSDGRPVIAYHDIANSSIKLAVCGSVDCFGGQTLTTVVDHASDIVGYYLDLELTDGDRPAISYARFSPDFSTGSVQYVRCTTTDCSGLQLPVTIAPARVRSFTGLELHPVQNILQIVYDRDGASPGIDVALCADLGCNSITSVENVVALTPGAPAGQGAGVASDASGNIVLSYYDGATADLRLVVCLNVGCPLGANGHVNTAISTAGNTGWRSVVAVPSNLPVVAYYDVTAAQYRMLRCLNLVCTQATPPVSFGASAWAFQVGVENSMDITLDLDDRPFVAATALAADIAVHVLKCESADCQ